MFHGGTTRDSRGTFVEYFPRTGADKRGQWLEKDMHRRLGYKLGGGGLQDIKAHPWFQGVDWDGIYRKEVAPPFEPDVSPQRGKEVPEADPAW